MSTRTYKDYKEFFEKVNEEKFVNSQTLIDTIV